MIWALNMESAEPHVASTTIDIFKQLIMQVLLTVPKSSPDRFSGLDFFRFQSAMSELQWFELLCAVLAGLSQIHIVIDLTLFNRDEGHDISWPSEFLQLRSNEVIKLSGTVVKILLITYGFGAPDAKDSQTPFDNFVEVKAPRQKGTVKNNKAVSRLALNRKKDDSSELLRSLLLNSSLAPHPPD